MNFITLEIQGWDFDYPGTSCKNILDSGFSKGDGEYWINPGWNGDPLKVYCDMTTDGGKQFLFSCVGVLKVCYFDYACRHIRWKLYTKTKNIFFKTTQHTAR